MHAPLMYYLAFGVRSIHQMIKAELECVWLVMPVTQSSWFNPAGMEPAETVTCVWDFDVWVYAVSAAQGSCPYIVLIRKNPCTHVVAFYLYPKKSKNF